MKDGRRLCVVSWGWMIVGGWVVVCCVLAGCVRLNSGNKGEMQTYQAPAVEAGWIRNGEPVIFEEDQWFAVDDTENLLDSEVYQVGEYKDVQLFVDKIDTKPYDRLYTKFAKGKFRYFERRNHD